MGKDAAELARALGAKADKKLPSSEASKLIGTGGTGSWGNPMYRKRDKASVYSTTVLIPLDIAMQLDAVRLKTRRRLSDIIEEATREWLKTNKVEL